MIDVMNLIMVLVTGIGSGLFYSFAGLLKSFRGEEFSKSKFVFSMLWGIVAGGFMGFAEIMGYNIDYMQISTWMGSLGFVVLLDYIAKFIIREHEHGKKRKKEDIK